MDILTYAALSKQIEKGNASSDVLYSLNEATGELLVYGANSEDDSHTLPWHGKINGAAVTGVRVLDGIKSLGSESFGGYSNLQCVSLPDSLIYLGRNSFKNCTSLQKLKLPPSVSFLQVNHIGTGLSGLQKIVYNELITRFNPDLCEVYPGLTTIVFPSASMMTVNMNLLSDPFFTASDCTLYVRSALLSQYKADSTFTEFFKDIKAIEDEPSCLW